jgi:hypothetical protein
MEIKVAQLYLTYDFVREECTRKKCWSNQRN